MHCDQEGNGTLTAEIREIFDAVVSANEAGWVEAIREASDHSDPPLTKRGLAAVRTLFGK